MQLRALLATCKRRHPRLTTWPMTGIDKNRPASAGQQGSSAARKAAPRSMSAQLRTLAGRGAGRAQPCGQTRRPGDRRHPHRAPQRTRGSHELFTKAQLLSQDPPALRLSSAPDRLAPVRGWAGGAPAGDHHDRRTPDGQPAPSRGPSRGRPRAERRGGRPSPLGHHRLALPALCDHAAHRMRRPWPAARPPRCREAAPLVLRA